MPLGSCVLYKPAAASKIEKMRKQKKTLCMNFVATWTSVPEIKLKCVLKTPRKENFCESLRETRI